LKRETGDPNFSPEKASDGTGKSFVKTPKKSEDRIGEPTPGQVGFKKCVK